MGNSTTIAHDVYNIEEANMVLLSLSESVGMRLRNRNLSGYVISVHIKFTNFESISKQKKQDSPINSTNLIYEEGRKLLKAIWKDKTDRH